MQHKIRVARTFVFEGDGITYSVEVLGERTYITEPGTREGDDDLTCVAAKTDGFPEILEALARFVREEQAKP